MPGSPETIRVVQACSSLSAGGMARIVLDLGQELAGSADVALLATGFPGRHWPAEGGGWSRRVVIRRGSKAARYATLYRLLRSWRPHVVHSHQEAYAPIVARWAGVPVRVETIHSAVNWRELGHPVVRRSRRSAVTQHVAVSDGLRDELIAGGELSAAEVTAIPNGIRVGEFRTPPAIIRFPTLGTAARFDRGKGLEYLLEAFRELRRAWPQARLVLAGDGPTRADLVELVNAHDLAPAVEMPGYVPDLRAVLRQLDVFVLPSLHEAFGLALGEAMAEGVPVVASNLPGPASLCRDGQEGLLVPPADARAIAAACARLLADAELRGRLARGGYERVRSQFTLARMGQAHLALYRGLLERHEVRCISRFADSEAGARLPDLAQSD